MFYRIVAIICFLIFLNGCITNCVSGRCDKQEAAIYLAQAILAPEKISLNCSKNEDVSCEMLPPFKEDFIGDWQGKLHGENIELALWFTRKGEKSELGGYVNFSDINCIQQLDGKLTSTQMYEDLNLTMKDILSEEQYLKHYDLAATFPEFTVQNKRCLHSKVIDKMNGVFSAIISINKYKKSIQLTDLLTDNKTQLNEIYSTIMKKSIISSTMLTLINNSDGYPYHPKPSEEEFEVLNTNFN